MNRFFGKIGDPFGLLVDKKITFSAFRSNQNKIQTTILFNF
jgi:hypothetical protein